LGLKPRCFAAALLLNISAFTKYMPECEIWKKPILTDFTPHPNKSRYCGSNSHFEKNQIKFSYLNRELV
jgi:hypothetical protein